MYYYYGTCSSNGLLIMILLCSTRNENGSKYDGTHSSEKVLLQVIQGLPTHCQSSSLEVLTAAKSEFSIEMVIL